MLKTYPIVGQGRVGQIGGGTAWEAAVAIELLPQQMQLAQILVLQI